MKHIILVTAIAALLGGCASVDTFREKHGFAPRHHQAAKMPAQAAPVLAPAAPVTAPAEVPPKHKFGQRLKKLFFRNRSAK